MSNTFKEPEQMIAVAKLAESRSIDITSGPSPDQVDAIILEFDGATRMRMAADEVEADAKSTLILLVRHWGHAAAGSEHSYLIEGALNNALVTDVTRTSLNEEKVQEIFELLGDQQRSDIFPRLFSTRIKHELADGADDALRTMDMPQWLRKRVKMLFAECLKVSKLAPRVKVDLRTKEPKQRKPRAKKAAAA